MKKIYGILIGGMCLLSFNSCSDDMFADKYKKPSQTNTVSCDKLMTGVFYKGNTWMNPVYYRYFIQSSTSGMFSQVIGSSNSKARYMGAGIGYYNERWMNFYDMLTQYRLLEKTYDELPVEEQSNYEVFKVLARSVMEEQLDEICSLFGDVPFTQAGTLWYNGDVNASKPAYDKATDIYVTILKDLKDANAFLSNASFTAFTQSTLTVQDYVNKGDVALWRKFVNSLRLRIAIRLASNGSLTSEAQSAIAEMLGDPNTYPMVDNYSEMSTIAQDDLDFNFDKSMQGALENSTRNRASGAMLRALNVASDGTYTNADPRLPVLYDSNWDDKYIGLDPTEELSDQESNMAIASHGNGKYYAAADTATFTRNPGLPGVWMTAAEVSFGKAEAYAMGWTGSIDAVKAKANFIQGMIQSTEYYYKLNSTVTYRNPIQKPSDDVILRYAESQWNAVNMQKCIITQKWINFGILNELEAWNCVRRTGYPELQFKRDDATSGYNLVLERLKYPTDEVSYNTANYNAATNNGQTDSWYNKLFWMKDSWYTVIE